MHCSHPFIFLGAVYCLLKCRRVSGTSKKSIGSKLFKPKPYWRLNFPWYSITHKVVYLCSTLILSSTLFLSFLLILSVILICCSTFIFLIRAWFFLWFYHLSCTSRSVV